MGGYSKEMERISALNTQDSLNKTMIGVFHETGTYNIYYTCCCRVMITQDQSLCPRCRQMIIPPRNREEFIRGTERKAQFARFLDRYMASGKYEAAKVAARLKGEIFISPTLCRTCGDPEPECKCIPNEWK